MKYVNETNDDDGALQHQAVFKIIDNMTPEIKNRHKICIFYNVCDT